MINKNNHIKIYIDNAATTPPAMEVIEAVRSAQDEFWGNCSSLHYEGVKALRKLEQSRQVIAEIVSSQANQIVFTSGATESINLALSLATEKTSRGRIVISSVEHPASLNATNRFKEQGWLIEEWPVNEEGLIDLNRLDQLLDPPTKILSIIWGQSEVGTIQPIELLAEECNNRGIIFHTDATQIIPHYSINWNKLNISFLSASAHKFNGPKGIGILLLGKNVIHHSEFRNPINELSIRPGTVALPLIVGMKTAFELIDKKTYEFYNSDNSKKTNLYSNTLLLRQKLSRNNQLLFTGHPSNRIPNHISMLVTDTNGNPINGRNLVYKLSNLGLCASTGTACMSGKSIDSHVLRAMNVDTAYLRSGLRFTLSSSLSHSEIIQIPDILTTAISDLTS